MCYYYYIYMSVQYRHSRLTGRIAKSQEGHILVYAVAAHPLPGPQ